MNQSKETPVYNEVYNHLGKKWYSLHPHDHDMLILRADVRPLGDALMTELIDKLVSNDSNRRHLLEKLHDINASVLARSEQIAIVLDGRSDGISEGYLGDMIEASRMVNVLRNSGKKVSIITPHQDLFEGNTDPEINIVPLPTAIWPEHTLPFSKDLLSYIHSQIGDTPCIFPMNANLPVFIQTSKEGLIQNNDTLDLSKEALRPEAKKMRITPTIWSKKGIHQLQAMQIIAKLLGFDKVSNWEQFPAAYLKPSLEARSIATEVVRIYGCFDHDIPNRVCPPLYIHPGVATNANKIATKFYPEAKWKRVIKELASLPRVANSLTFLEPTDPLQGAMTLRLATTAVEAGLHVAKVPMSSVKEKYGWSLGSFIAFLQQLSEHRGIIVGCDSMPAGHAGPATGNPAVVLGSVVFNQGFFCPEKKALVVLPTNGPYTAGIDPLKVVTAIHHTCADKNLQYAH